MRYTDFHLQYRHNPHKLRCKDNNSVLKYNNIQLDTHHFLQSLSFGKRFSATLR